MGAIERSRVGAVAGLVGYKPWEDREQRSNDSRQSQMWVSGLSYSGFESPIFLDKPLVTKIIFLLFNNASRAQ